MSVKSSEGPPDPATALSAYARIALSEVVSIVVLSIVFTISMLPVVTIGAAVIALVDTFYASVTFTGSGGGLPPKTSARANHFVASIWTYLRTGLAYTVILLMALVGLPSYFALAFLGGTTGTLFVGIAGIYAVVIVLVLIFRAANIVAHADEDKRPGFRSAISEAWSSVTGNLAYESLHVVVAATLVLLSLFTPSALAAFIFLPGLLALLEVLMYEELEGVGAETVLYAYKDPQS